MKKKDSYTIYETGKRDLYNPFDSEGIDEMIEDEEGDASWHVNLTNLERENEFNPPEKWSPSKEGQRYPFMSKEEYDSHGYPDGAWWVKTLAFVREVNSKYIIKVTAQDYEILYHGSNNPNLTKVNELNEPNDLFGGIFASYDYDAAYSHGKYMYEIQLKQDEMLEDIPDTPQVLSIIENETEIRDSDYEEGKKDEKYIQDLDLLYSVVGLEKNLFALDNWIDFRDFDEYKNAEGEDRWHIAHDIEERIQKRICELLGKDDLGYAGWETQRIRGVIAKKLGYKAVSTKDEHGVSYLILPSVELKKIKGE